MPSVQRVLDPAPVSAATCVACDSASNGDRCGHCGAAARAGPYRVLKVLSRSQHGAMYLAEDDAGAKVALKELVFSLVPTTQELDAFTRETQLLQALSHLRIPKFLKSFTVGQGVSTRLYLAQQYLTGQSLMDRLATEHFDEAAVLVLARQALDVLSYLHGRSPVVIHRDVKPDNFILGADGSLSLVDFGAARSVNAAGTHRATLVGTFGYMAPEQLGGTVDSRSDLYGLGATLVHLLTRTPPERLLGPGMSLDFQRHVNVSVKTERFLARLVATRPGQRFASAADALAYLDGRATSTPPSPSRGLLGLGAVGVALLLGGLVTLLAQREAAPAVAAVVAPPVVAELPGEAVAPAPRAEEVKLPTRTPPRGDVRFPWIQAKWNFNKPGHWVIDESGRGHHALLPVSGFTNDFFGLRWDGTQQLTVPDSDDFAPTGPFTISLRLTLSEGKLTQPATLVSRGDPNGSFAWALQLIPAGAARKLRFSISDADGKVESVEGLLLDGKSDQLSVYASFDPKDGALWIHKDCVTLGRKVTALRPAKKLPADAKLQLITGFRGVANEIELERGLMMPTGEAGHCGYQGERLGED